MKKITLKKSFTEGKWLLYTEKPRTSLDQQEMLDMYYKICDELNLPTFKDHKTDVEYLEGLRRK